MKMYQKRFQFDNGYGVSLIRNNRGLRMFTRRWYEIAVLHNGKICYDSGITEDVICDLSVAGVKRILQQVRALPRKGSK